MIEIDLFPEELREKKRFKLNFKPGLKTKLVYTVLGSIILFHLLLHVIGMFNTRRISVLKRNRQNLSSQKQELSQLKAELANLNSKIPLIEQLIKNRVVWSKKLNRISELLVSGIWLNEIALEGPGKQSAKGALETLECLVIRGSAASKTKDEPALIGRFMQNLKDDPQFSDDFSDIELGPIKKRQIAQTEVMDFILICQFKSEKVQSLLK